MPGGSKESSEAALEAYWRYLEGLGASRIIPTQSERDQVADDMFSRAEKRDMKRTPFFCVTRKTQYVFVIFRFCIFGFWPNP